jgi:hypothetical protein
VNAKFKALFSGLTTGFTGYTNELAIKKDLDMLGEGYYSEYINLRDVPKGERIYDTVSIEDATFWVCGEIPIELQVLQNYLTPGKAYELLYDAIRDEYYFHDNQGNNTNYFLVVPGEFVQ